MEGKEDDIFRRVLFWSIALTFAMGAIVYSQSTSLFDWMVP
jgi:lactate permease